MGADAWVPDAATELDASTPDAGNPVVFTGIRIMAANLTSGNNQTYDGTATGGPAGIRIMQGLKPDIILIQEFNYDPDGNRVYTAEEIRSLVDQVCGPSCDYHREPGSSGTVIPNGVISRWPILDRGNWDDTQVSNRSFVWAKIDIPGPRKLWAVSVHLPTDDIKRPTSAVDLVDAIMAHGIPPEDYLVVGGDLNTDLVVETTITTLSAVVETSVMPADQAGNVNTSSNRTKPYDRVLPDQDLEVYRVPTVIGANSFANGLVFDSRVYNPLEDVAPVRREDSENINNNTQMQHMGVVKDFLLPAQ